MHRFTAFLLATLLLAGLCVPAMAAAESADARLARVTQAVKDTLDLDTEAFTDFHGDVYEQELGTVWTLSWSGNGTSLNIEALEDGTVVNYWRSDSDEDVYFSGYDLPSLPKLDVAAAKQAASAFLNRVLDGKTERVELGEPASATRLGSTTCRFSGTILLNGLPSPLHYSISVRGSDNAVTSFNRDALATSFLGNVPSAKPAVSKDAAAKTLKDTLKLELIYVVSEDDEAKAMLRYVPKGYETQYVDAQTGKLVTPSGELYAFGANASAATPEAAEDAGSTKRALTAAELSGIEKLEGVRDSAALDKLIRTESAYMLDGYTLSTANYRLVKEKDAESVLCTIRYAAAEDEDGYTASRTFTVDARTGEVKSLYSGGRWDKDAKSAVALAAAQSTAENFLKRFTAHADEFALYDTSDNTAEGAPFYGFTFARKVSGCFFPANACTIQIDRMTGAVAGVSYTYDDAVKFDAADGLVSDADALDAWMATYEVQLAYRTVQKELSKSVAAEAKLIDMGYTRFRTLLLTYGLEREGYIPGIDAKTGKPVEIKQTANEIAYSDVANHWAAKEIGTLAQYGVGYGGETFRPNKQLTQWELVALLVSTRGLRLDPDNASEDERNSAYDTAYRMGALTRGERSDDALVFRGDLVRILLNSAGYGQVANLVGIYTCSYPDAASIQLGDLGYAALAQGFGMVKGNYDGGSVATRAVAAVMLYRLMERNA